LNPSAVPLEFIETLKGRFSSFEHMSASSIPVNREVLGGNVNVCPYRGKSLGLSPSEMLRTARPIEPPYFLS
jgi:hypothetical protein